MIVIIDNYDSFTYNLVDIVASSGADYQVIRNDQMTIQELSALNPSGILISPGPGRPEDAGISQEAIAFFGPKIPVFGVCLGHQALAQVYGGEVVHAPRLMHGKTSEIYHEGEGIYESISKPFTATRYHSLIVKKESLPKDLLITSWTQEDEIMGLKHRHYPVEGVQFHPESILTSEGAKLVLNWIRSITR